MSIGGGVGVGIGGQSAPPAGGASNPNLLLFPEAFDNAIWLKALGAVVTANPGDATHPTADRIDFSAGGKVAQTATQAAIAGSASFTLTLVSGWSRYSVTGAVDGLPYTFSLELLGGADAGSQLQLFVGAVGGFLQVYARDLGDLPVVLAYGAKLEQAASFSAYP